MKDDMCCICLDTVYDERPISECFDLKTSTVITACCHKFHSSCLSKFLDGSSQRRSCCPLCCAELRTVSNPSIEAATSIKSVGNALFKTASSEGGASVKSAGSAPINKTSSRDVSESGIQEVSGVKSVGSTLLKPASEEDDIAAPTSSDLFKPSGR